MINQIRKCTNAIREGRFIELGRNYLAAKLVTEKYRVIKNMNYTLSDRGRAKISSMDFVRTGSLELMAHEINQKGLSGCVAEVGVYKGDFAKYINEVFPDRKFYLFDTFEGFYENDIQSDVNAGYSTGNHPCLIIQFPR